jgi:hypothetical protein
MAAALFWLTSSAIDPEPAGLRVPPARTSTIDSPAPSEAREQPPPAAVAVTSPGEPGAEGRLPPPIAGSVIADTASHVLPSPAPTPEPTLETVNLYLWNAYERSTIKRDQSGDFTWKDVASAARLSMSRGDYVIRGMDPDFREVLYHAGLALDAAGIPWTILSGFRDDYRQGLAAGYKARVDNSLHGGSAATGGYGHGCAVDVIAPDHKSALLWKWLDTNGTQMGLQRPFPGIDPAHVLPRGAWHELAQALRHDRLTEPAEAADGAPAIDPAAIDAAAPSEADAPCINAHRLRNIDPLQAEATKPPEHKGFKLAAARTRGAEKPSPHPKTAARSLARHATHREAGAI